MPPGGNLRRRAGATAIAALALAAALLPGSALAAADPADGGDLSARLAELARPGLRAAPPATQAEALGLAPNGPGSLLREGGRVLVEVRFAGGAAIDVEALRAAGARPVDVSSRYRTATASVRASDLRSLAAVAGVDAVHEVLAPFVSATGCTGLVTSEGDSQLRAGEARDAFNLDGGGVTVGILSDSFDTDGSAPTHAGGDVASGDLPGAGNPCGRTQPVSVLDEYAASTPLHPQQGDEGRAMAQIVHDLAPGAGIAFATAFEGALSFAANIKRLGDPGSAGGAGASVIADDVTYFEEPFFQDGPIAVAANEANARGVAYFSAAGNDNLLDEEGNEIASWEAPSYRDAGACPPALVALSEEVEAEEEKELEEAEETGEPEGLHPEHCMDFDPASGAEPEEVDDTFGITVEEGATLVVDLQWGEPWFGVETDLDAFLFDVAGEDLAVSREENVAGSERPFELVAWENDTGADAEVQLVVNRFDGTADPRLKFALLQNGGGVSATEYPQSSGGDVVGPTIFGHSGASGAVSVGAVRYSTASSPEEYSSRGPVTHYFAPVTGPSPAAPLGSPQEIPKPDLAATDCGLTTFFTPTPTPSVYRFCGTSAAAPHAAAVAALMRQANPSLGVSQIRTALAASARPVGSFGVDAVGAGLLDAFAAVRSVALPPRVTITQVPPPLSKERRPVVAFTASRPVAFTCSIDGGPLQACASPFAPAPLADGVHAIAVRGTDVAGRSGVAETARFSVDGTPPRTFFGKRPRKSIRTNRRKARAVFRFRSNEPGVTFICRVDGGLFRVCKAKYARRYRIGTHTVKVQARDLAGNVDPTPAVYRFKVKRRG